MPSMFHVLALVLSLSGQPLGPSFGFTEEGVEKTFKTEQECKDWLETADFKERWVKFKDWAASHFSMGMPFKAALGCAEIPDPDNTI